MLYFALFLFELILLLFLSKKLINSLAKIIYRFTKSHKVVVHALAIIFLPGTIIHELAHLLFAGIMLVPVGEMNVVPEIEGEGVKLGSVQIGHTDPFRRAIIGVAPVILGMLLIMAAFLIVKNALVIFIVFEIANTMFSSKKDLEGSILFMVLAVTLITIIALVLYFLAPAIAQSIWVYLNNINFEIFINFFKQASIYLIIPVVLDLLIIFLTRFASSTSK